MWEKIVEFPGPPEAENPITNNGGRGETRTLDTSIMRTEDGQRAHIKSIPYGRRTRMDV
jgi:hypothetical protein